MKLRAGLVTGPHSAGAHRRMMARGSGTELVKGLLTWGYQPRLRELDSEVSWLAGIGS